MSNMITENLDPSFKKIIRRSYYFLIDSIDSLLGKRDWSIPPKRLIFIGDGDFKDIGNRFFRHFVDKGGLKSDARVLDVGCGIGRMAIPLTNYLVTGGSYEGFDIVQDGIKWCQKNITPKFPNFRFTLADVYNKAYHPQGRYKASQYTFPYEDSSFDFVFLTSVFTHMLPEDLEKYLCEISRVLKPGGKTAITFFLINVESMQLMGSHKSSLDFKFENRGHRTTDKHNPEAAIAFEEVYVRETHEKYGLRIVEPIYFGAWCGRESFLDYQDLVIGSKQA